MVALPKWFDDLPWYVKHVLVALVIMAVVGFFLGAWAGACAASGFYIGREYVEYEKQVNSQTLYDTLLGCVPPTVVTCSLANLISLLKT